METKFRTSGRTKNYRAKPVPSHCTKLWVKDMCKALKSSTTFKLTKEAQEFLDKN